MLCCFLARGVALAMYSTARAAPSANGEKMKQREREGLEKAIYPTPARKRNLKRIACYALLAAAVIAVPGTANAGSVFFKLNNRGDPNFNQLLGISALMTTKSSLAISGTAPRSSIMGTF